QIKIETLSFLDHRKRRPSSSIDLSGRSSLLSGGCSSEVRRQWGCAFVCVQGAVRLYALHDMSLTRPRGCAHYFTCYKRSGGCECFMWCKLRSPAEDDDEYVETYDEMIMRNVDLKQQNERLWY
ncbi:hypothetical protein LINPERHAP2_LOCUS39567, partial [Linum perenne]